MSEHQTNSLAATATEPDVPAVVPRVAVGVGVARVGVHDWGDAERRDAGGAGSGEAEGGEPPQVVREANQER